MVLEYVKMHTFFLNKVFFINSNIISLYNFNIELTNKVKFF